MATFNSLTTARPSVQGEKRDFSNMIPPNTLNDGIAPTGFVVAPYLPLLNYDESKYTYTVIGTGKPVALDSKGSVVLAGLALDYAAYKKAPESALVRYTQLDVSTGILNAAGKPVTVGEAVVASFDEAGIKVGNYIGVTVGEVFRHAGGDNTDPTKLNYINFNIQPVITILRDSHMQYPVVTSVEVARATAVKGFAVVIAADEAAIDFGGFLTFDAESNLVFDTEPNLKHTVLQVTGLRKYRDPATLKVTNTHNLLDRVVAPNPATQSVLDRTASSATGGMGSYITYSGGWAVLEGGLVGR